MTSSTESGLSAVQRVGVIGIGTMGRCMVEKLIEGGFDTTAYDILPDAVNFAIGKGLFAASTPAELAERSELIIMSLPGPVQIEEVLFGKNGVIESVQKGTVVVDTSTVDPASTQRAAERLAQCGVEYLDCPVLGRPSAVGKWLLPTGGDATVLERARPVLKTFAANAVWVGKSGSGNAVKLLNQMMFTVINAISAEVLAISDYCGVSREVFYNTVASSSAATVSGLFKEVGRFIVSDDFTHPAFTVDLLIKDTRLALQMARDAGAPSVVAATAQIFNEIASANGLGREDTSALFKTYQRHYK